MGYFSVVVSGLGGVRAGVCDPAADEYQEAVEAAGGQLAERDFRPQDGQVPLAVEPRDAQGAQSPGQPAAVLLVLVRRRTAHCPDADLQGRWSAMGAGVQGQHPAPARASGAPGIGLTVSEGYLSPVPPASRRCGPAAQLVTVRAITLASPPDAATAWITSSAVQRTVPGCRPRMTS